MVNTSYKTERIIHFLFIIIVFINGSFTIDDSNFKSFILIILLFVFVSQVRHTFNLNNIAFLVTIFINIGLTFYIHNQFGGFSYLLIYITLIDSLIFLGFEAYPLCVIISGFLIYFLKNKSADSIMLSIIIFFLTYVFAKHIKRLRDSIKKIEYLYDENRNYSYELEETKKRIENFAKMVEKVSQLEERNRISREIHDSIGHKLTGILMQLEACIRVGEVDEKKSKELLHLVRDNLKQCSETLRQTVKGLKPTKIKDRMLSIKQMISSFEKATCVKINYQIRGMRYKLNPSIEMVIYRNIQEALTNSVRHGKASAIDVILEYNDDKIVLSVRDNGVGCDQIHAGMGISGMDERVRVIGGKIEIYNGNGLIIKTVIPIIMKQVV